MMRPTFVIEDDTFVDVQVVAGGIVWLFQTSAEDGKQAQINLSREGARELATKLLEELA